MGAPNGLIAIIAEASQREPAPPAFDWPPAIPASGTRWRLQRTQASQS